MRERLRNGLIILLLAIASVRLVIAITNVYEGLSTVSDLRLAYGGGLLAIDIVLLLFLLVGVVWSFLDGPYPDQLSYSVLRYGGVALGLLAAFFLGALLFGGVQGRGVLVALIIGVAAGLLATNRGPQMLPCFSALLVLGFVAHWLFLVAVALLAAYFVLAQE